tara:strand:- start:898 stop:1254 length:357 start_codon:yes stop_codon:yes gene_type:complete
MKFNADGASLYKWTTADGYGNSFNEASSLSGFDKFYNGAGFVNIGPGRGLCIWQIFDYAQTNKHTNILVRSNNTSETVTTMLAGTWGSTVAVNQIRIETQSNGVYLAGSTFYLYGIAA